MKDRDAYIVLEQLEELQKCLDKAMSIIGEYTPEEKRDTRCLNCGKYFKKRANSQKFCCEDCKKQARERKKNGD